MAKRRTKGTLSQRAAKSVGEHKNDETRYGIINLPGGIQGIAELTECRIGHYKEGTNEGEPFLYMAGTVVSPDAVNGTPTQGLRTSQIEPLCDTTTRAGKETSFDEHVSNALNRLRQVGLETSDYEDEQLEEMIEDLGEQAKSDDEGPFFRFSTTWRDDDDHSKGAWENWQGNKGLEDYSKNQEDDVVEDEGDDEEEEEEVEEVEEESQEEEVVYEDVDPQVGDVYSYKPPRKKAPIDGEVTTVNTKGQTVSLKHGKTLYKNVPWSELVVSE